MYEISRLLLMIAIIAGVYCIGAIAELSWPGSSIFVVAPIVIAALRKKRGCLTTLGSAHWAGGGPLAAASDRPSASGTRPWAPASPRRLGTFSESERPDGTTISDPRFTMLSYSMFIARRLRAMGEA